MTVEVAVVAVLLIAGVPLAAALDLKGMPALAVGFVFGTAALVSVGGILVMLGFDPRPVLVLFLTLAFGVVAGWRGRAYSVGGFRRPTSWVLLPASLLLIGFLRWWGAVNLTPDSFRYLTTGALIANGKLDEASGFLLLTRGLAVPLLHSPANLVGELHLRAITPLFALATVGILVWAIQVGLGQRGIPREVILLAQVAAAVLLLSINRFVFHAFYVNGHLFTAGWVLLLAVSIWHGRAHSRSPSSLAVARSLLVIAVVLARPDGAVLVGLVLLPLVAGQPEETRAGFGPLLTMGAVILGWNVTITRFYPPEPGAPLEVRGLIVVGAALVLVALALRARPHWLPRRLGALVEVSLWAAVVAGSVRYPDILKDSVRATYQNTLLGAGGWGISLGVLGVLVVGVLLVSADASRTAVRFPVTAFVPLAILLAFLRGSAYRVGPGDSLNRMLIHIVPLAVLLLVSAVAAPRWRRPAASSSDGEAAPSWTESGSDRA